MIYSYVYIDSIMNTCQLTITNMCIDCYSALSQQMAEILNCRTTKTLTREGNCLTVFLFYFIFVILFSLSQ